MATLSEEYEDGYDGPLARRLPEPQELGIPVPGWRDFQPGIIDWLETAYDKHPIAVLNAPPGVGKSIIALGYARQGSHTVLMLTGTKQLQEQYATTAPGIVDMRGRGNFPCPLLGHPYRADEGVCTIGEPCEFKIPDPVSGEIVCPYYRRKKEATNALEVVSGYQYFLRDLTGGRHLSPQRGPRDLLVLDEAHELEDHLRHWKEVEVSKRARQLLGIRETTPADPEWLQGIVHLAGEWMRSNDDTRRFWGESPREERRDYTSIQRLSEALGPVAKALTEEPDSWVYEYDKTFDRLTYKPVLVSGVVSEALWKSASRFLLMSATITEIDLTELGLLPEQYSYRELPSPFPAHNRPIIYRPSGKVRQNMDPEQMTEWVDSLDDILETHSNEKGLIHTANYRLASYYLEHSRFTRRLMTHSGLTRSTSLDAFKSSPLPVVLVSPSMTTGVDLPYDLCRFQIIAKLAWPNRGDSQINKRMLMPGGDAWYANRTVSHLVQAYGRGVRAADDSALLYIVDSTFSALRARWGSLIPRYFKEALINASRR